MESGFAELIIHHFWKNQTFPAFYRSTCNKEVQVLFPGWYNTGRGPDFTSAKIIIDTVEYFGDVEIHRDEADWYRHQHDDDSAYGKVLLHVFVFPGKKQAVLPDNRTTVSVQIPQALIMPFLMQPQNRLMKTMQGACGITISGNNYSQFRKILFSAAETRIISKYKVLQPELHNALRSGNEERFLYEKIFEAMGTPNFKGIFSFIATRYSYAQFLADASKYSSDAEVAEFIISRWKELFLVFPEYTSGNTDNTNRADAAVKKTDPFSGVYHNPLHRFQYLFRLLYATKDTSLLNAWSNKLENLADAADTMGSYVPTENSENSTSKITGAYILKHFSTLFITSADQKETGKTGISADKLVILLANAVMPYFLAWADIHGDEKLRRLLYRMFVVLPSEGTNRKVSFMKTRLGISGTPLKLNALWDYQGLIQLHDDCCHYFDKGCQSCSLAQMLSVP